MNRRLSVAGFASLITALPFSLPADAQTPRRDITGIWQPVRGIEGIQPNGALAMPADGKHEPPYTPLGLEAFKSHRPSNGPTEVAAAEENDPAHTCDPQGFPRENLFELRATQFIQTPLQVVMLYTYDRVYRVVWTDGRELAKDPGPQVVWVFGGQMERRHDLRCRDQRYGRKNLAR